jgi:hypothetical protein
VKASNEPVIVSICPHAPDPRRASLADVIIMGDDHPTGDLRGELFARYPGLTLVLMSMPAGEVTAGLRDGTTVTLQPGHSWSTSVVDLVRARWPAIVELLATGLPTAWCR